jgi:hypothetical protein
MVDIDSLWQSERFCVMDLKSRFQIECAACEMHFQNISKTRANYNCYSNSGYIIIFLG